MTNIEAVDNTQDKWRHVAQTMSDAETTQNSKAASESSTIPEPKGDKNQWIQDNWDDILTNLTNNGWESAEDPSPAYNFCNYADQLATSSAGEPFNCHTGAAEAVYIFAKYKAYPVSPTIDPPPIATTDPIEIKNWITNNQAALLNAFNTNWPDEKTALKKDIFYSGFIPTKLDNLKAFANGLYALATHATPPPAPLTKNRTEYFVKTWNIDNKGSSTPGSALNLLKTTLTENQVGTVNLFYTNLDDTDPLFGLGTNPCAPDSYFSDKQNLTHFVTWCHTNHINVRLSVQAKELTWESLGTKTTITKNLAQLCSDCNIDGLDFDAESANTATEANKVAAQIKEFESNLQKDDPGFKGLYSGDFDACKDLMNDLVANGAIQHTRYIMI